MHYVCSFKVFSTSVVFSMLYENRWRTRTKHEYGCLFVLVIWLRVFFVVAFAQRQTWQLKRACCWCVGWWGCSCSCSFLWPVVGKEFRFLFFVFCFWNFWGVFFLLATLLRSLALARSWECKLVARLGLRKESINIVCMAWKNRLTTFLQHWYYTIIKIFYALFEKRSVDLLRGFMRKPPLFWWQPNEAQNFSFQIFNKICTFLEMTKKIKVWKIYIYMY